MAGALTLTGGQGIWYQATVGANVSSVAADLTPPGSDKILFWDHSALSLVYLTLGTNLAITGTTLDASGGGGGMSIGGTVTSGTATRVLFVGTGPVLADDADFTWDAGLLTLTDGLLNTSGVEPADVDVDEGYIQGPYLQETEIV